MFEDEAAGGRQILSLGAEIPAKKVRSPGH